MIYTVTLNTNIDLITFLNKNNILLANDSDIQITYARIGGFTAYGMSALKITSSSGAKITYNHRVAVLRLENTSGYPICN